MNPRRTDNPKAVTLRLSHETRRLLVAMKSQIEADTGRRAMIGAIVEVAVKAMAKKAGVK